MEFCEDEKFKEVYS